MPRLNQKAKPCLIIRGKIKKNTKEGNTNQNTALHKRAISETDEPSSRIHNIAIKVVNGNEAIRAAKRLWRLASSEIKTINSAETNTLIA